MKLAWKEISRNKMRFVMIGLIILLITWLVFILSGLGNGLSTLNAATIKNLPASHLVYQAEAEHKFSKSLITATKVAEIEKQPGVKRATPLGTSIASVINESQKDDKKTDITLMGIIPGSFIEPEVVEGKALTANKRDIIVDASIKEAGYKLGDTIQLSGFKRDYKIVGFVKGETFNHLPTIIYNITEWRDYRFTTPGSDDGVKAAANAIVVDTTSAFSAEAVEKKVKDTEVVTRAQAVQAMPGYAEENGTILMMLAFLIVISAFVIGVFFFVITMQKVNQFGVMKAIGANNRFISRMIISQVSIISLISIVAGIALTYLTALVFPAGMPFALDIKMIVLYAVLLFIISVLSSVFSVRKILKIDPLIALGRVE
ncbi:ABC transporter permease [Brochothrix campestris]|uniref:Putative hemin transport system permease protein HrtB n=1 Tax=Brochothrix campestris FSL F6-1037 TaxID=1265861 RepID=W7CXK3_9LIST|nr:ABC transporter permease [Brochothrix campestris]EUJ41707.1 antimicrobial peptide ABC transporter permease [Brochothrix campestris FSL F6-1037]